MSTNTRPNGFAALFAGLKSALQWRLLLWWIVALSLPTLLFSLPLWHGLQSQFGKSTVAADVAAGRDLPMLIEGINAMTERAGVAIGAGLLASLALTLLLTPWLTGMAVAAIRAGRILRLGELAHGGLAEYGRMLRLLLWSAVPVGIAVALGSALAAFFGKQAETAILQSEVERNGNIALAVLAVLFVFAHSTIEAARGWLGAEPGLRSIFRAWWCGTKLVLRRPLASLAVYVGTAAAAYALALLFGYLRLRSDGAGFGSFLAGLLLTQLVVAAIAWGRIARLYGFAELARGRIADKATAKPAETATAAQSGNDSSDPETIAPLPSA